MANSGQVSAEDLIWKQGMAEWVKAGSAKGLFSTASQQTSASAAKGLCVTAKDSGTDATALIVVPSSPTELVVANGSSSPLQTTPDAVERWGWHAGNATHPATSLSDLYRMYVAGQLAKTDLVWVCDVSSDRKITNEVEAGILLTASMATPTDGETSWLVERKGKSHGPYSIKLVARAYANEKLDDDTVIIRHGCRPVTAGRLFNPEYDHHVDDDVEPQPEQQESSRKQKAVLLTLVIGTVLLYAFWQTPKLFSSWIFWNWIACIVILPAMLHKQSMADGTWPTLGEVVLRTLLSYTAGTALGFVCLIGTYLALGVPLVEADKWFPKWAIIATSIGVAFIPPRLSVLAALFAGTAFILVRMTHDRRHGLCHECQGTGYCWPCRGAGCGRCMFTGHCGGCLGTGGQSRMIS